MKKFTGTNIDNRYFIYETISAGDYVSIYKATDKEKNCTVALKVIDFNYSHNPFDRRELINKKDLLLSLNHNHLVNIHSIIFRDNVVFIIMDYVEAISLKEYIKRAGKLNSNDALGLISQIVKTLGELNIVHKNISSENILLNRNGEVLLKNFVIENKNKVNDLPCYISPEEVEGKKADRKSDIYSIGIVLYEMLTGKVPFDGKNPKEIAQMHVTSSPQKILQRNPSIPLDVVEFCENTLWKNPASRYNTYKQMLHKINGILHKNSKVPYVKQQPLRTSKITNKPNGSNYANQSMDKISNQSTNYRTKNTTHKGEIKMAQNESLFEGINRDKYQITCPYCFWKFNHTEVEFRAAGFHHNKKELEQKLGYSEVDIEMMNDSQERMAKAQKYRDNEYFIPKQDPKYQNFWSTYTGITTEPVPKKQNPSDPNPWELPIVDHSRMKSLNTDPDGFVISCTDNVFGKESRDRVCPECHNPLPTNYGKNSVKMISIIGVTGSGKTVYISQLLKGMDEYVNKAGLSAFFTSTHERDFVENNMVKKGMPLPDSTSPGTLSQPMFYDLSQPNAGNGRREDTIVLYDIAGENCRQASDMIKFAKFVENSDGIIILIDPKQLKFVGDDEVDDAPALALTTLHNVIIKEKDKLCETPIAVCVSKSDQCWDILPSIAADEVQRSEADFSGLPKCEFDGRTYNQLQQELTTLMMRNALAVCNGLRTQYKHYNFFAVSAIGCEVNENGPIDVPNPKRIEEPILWLLKQFGYIKSNSKVNIPFPIMKKITVQRNRTLIEKLKGVPAEEEIDQEIRFEEDLH